MHTFKPLPDETKTLIHHSSHTPLSAALGAPSSIIDALRVSLEQQGITTHYAQQISAHDAEYISDQLTRLQNFYKASGQLVPIRRVSSEEIATRARNGYFVVKDASSCIIACIFLYRYEQLYRGQPLFERVTLRKDQGFRESYKLHHPDSSMMTIGQYLMGLMTQRVGEQALVSVTNNPHIIANNSSLGYYILSRDQLPPDLEQILGEYKDLGDPSYDEKSFCLNPQCYHLAQSELSSTILK